MACLPATVATAYFIAVILLDLFHRDWRRIPGHALLGAFVYLIVQFICEKGSESMAWILIIAPFLFVLIGYFFRLLFSVDVKGAAISAVNESALSSTDISTSECPCCLQQPCQCNMPCPSSPPPPPPPPATPAPACPSPPPPPPPEVPKCKPKSDSCIKGSYAD